MHVSNLYRNPWSVRLAEELAAQGPRDPRLLLQQRRRGQRGRDQARAPPRALHVRRRPPRHHQRGGLIPRPHVRRPDRHGTAEVPGGLRTARPRLPLRPLRRPRCARGRRHRRCLRRPARTDPGRERRARAAARVPCRRREALRRPRGAARVRRGADRPRAHGDVSRLRGGGRPPRCRDPVKIARRGHRARGDAGARRGGEGVRPRLARLDLRRQPGLLRRGAGLPRDARRRQAAGSRARDRRLVHGRAARAGLASAEDHGRARPGTAHRRRPCRAGESGGARRRGARLPGQCRPGAVPAVCAAVHRHARGVDRVPVGARRRSCTRE